MMRSNEEEPYQLVDGISYKNEESKEAETEAEVELKIILELKPWEIGQYDEDNRKLEMLNPHQNLSASE
jgi:hypothetical protein